jgi:hypothetical protein
MKLITFVTLVLIGAGLAQAEPRDDRRNRNYILRRQQAYQVQGVPTQRLIIGRRQIDIYRGSNGTRLMFERDNLIGVTR